MSALRKTMLYLGLADDDGYDEAPVDEYDDYEETPPPMREYSADVTPIRRASLREAAPVAAPVADLRRITTIHPRSYNDARLIGEA
ncbi:MAG: cell division protein SepF, partial [Cellulomonadaceae bacterium]|nr:cell division protein SepF [Cellulomonadaceae bacterium]